MSDYVIERVVGELRRLPEDLQRRVMSYTETLRATLPSGIPGRDLLTFAGTIPANDLLEMREAIEEGCEQVDPSEW